MSRREDRTEASPQPGQAEAGPGEVKIRVRAVGICGTDLHGHPSLDPPVILGHEAAGIVDAVGEGVTHLEVGDHVVLTPCPPCGACYWCVRRNAETATATFSDRVAPTSEMAFGVRPAPAPLSALACRLCSPLTERCVCARRT